MKKVIYHANCNDGILAAAIAYQYFTLDKGRYIELIPMNYGDNIPNFYRDDEVYILDFSFKRDVLIKINETVNSVTVIDHHKTAQKELEGLDFCHFDMTKSGAVMTWEYFYPEENEPASVSYVSDRDLWKFELEETKAFSAGVRVELGINPVDWVCLLSCYSDKVDDAIDTGKAIIKYQDDCIKNIKPGRIKEILTYAVPFQACTHLISETGNALSKDHPFSCTYFDLPDKRVYSLRSQPGQVDVSGIAKHFGGGGHANAAGFTLEYDDERFF